MRYLKVAHLMPDFAAEHPYNLQLVGALRELGAHVKTVRTKSFVSEVSSFKPDIVHIHWLHSFVDTDADADGALVCIMRMLDLVKQLVILKLKGIKIVWTVHELNIPETHHRRIDNVLNKAVATLADAIVAHGKNARDLIVAAACPRSPQKVKVVPHGNFIEVTENTAARSDARAELGIDPTAFVVLFFGLIRPYKGTLDLVKAHSQMNQDDVILLIAGGSVMHHQECVDYIDEIKRLTDSKANVKLMFGFIAPEKIQVVMNACDVVVFPYREIMTSGALIMAMGFGKPCIAARVGCIGETLDDQGAYLYDIGDASGLLNALRKAFVNREQLPEMGKHNLQLARDLNWQSISQKTLDVYRGLQ